jgi:hypothetical protein
MTIKTHSTTWTTARSALDRVVANDSTRRPNEGVSSSDDVGHDGEPPATKSSDTVVRRRDPVQEHHRLYGHTPWGGRTVHASAGPGRCRFGW